MHSSTLHPKTHPERKHPIPSKLPLQHLPSPVDRACTPNPSKYPHAHAHPPPNMQNITARSSSSGDASQHPEGIALYNSPYDAGAHTIKKTRKGPMPARSHPTEVSISRRPGKTSRTQNRIKQNKAWQRKRPESRPGGAATLRSQSQTMQTPCWKLGKNSSKEVVENRERAIGRAHRCNLSVYRSSRATQG
jgi:hypothetical protein